MKERLTSYFELSKAGIVTLVVVTSAIGYFLGGHGIQSAYILFITLIGTAVSCSGASALNQYLERDADAKMNRTMNRPLPGGRLHPTEALLFGIIMSLAGTALLAWQVNLLCGFLALLTTFLYALVYTPLKRATWLNTAIGAIPGALPIMGGWAAATNSLDTGAWVLFAIMFIWQHPHFYAIAWICKEDYARGGFKMLPVVEPDGHSTFIQIVVFSLILLPVSLVPTALEISGMWYFYGAIILGMMMIMYSFMSARSHSIADARKLFRFSLLYLPILLALIVTDRQF